MLFAKPGDVPANMRRFGHESPLVPNPGEVRFEFPSRIRSRQVAICPGVDRAPKRLMTRAARGPPDPDSLRFNTREVFAVVAPGAAAVKETVDFFFAFGVNSTRTWSVIEPVGSRTGTF